MVSFLTPLPALEAGRLPPELVPSTPLPPSLVAPSRPRKSSRRKPSRAVGVDSSSDVGDSSSTSLEGDSEVFEILGTEVHQDARGPEGKEENEEDARPPRKFGSTSSTASTSMLGVQDLREVARTRRRRKNEEEMRARWGSNASLRTYRSGRSGSSGESLYEDASAGMSSTDEDDGDDVVSLLDPSQAAQVSSPPPHRPSPPRRTASESTLSGSLYSFGDYSPQTGILEQDGTPRSLDKSTPRSSPRRRVASLQTYSASSDSGRQSDFVPGTLKPSLFIQAPSPSVTPSGDRSRSPLTTLTPRSSSPEPTPLLSSALTRPSSPQKNAWRPRPLFLNRTRSFTPETSLSTTIPPSPSSPSSSVGVISPISSPSLSENSNWPALSPTTRQIRSIGYFSAQQELSASKLGYDVEDQASSSSSDGGLERERTLSVETKATSESSQRSSRGESVNEGEGKVERGSLGKEEEWSGYDSVEVEDVLGIRTEDLGQETEEEEEEDVTPVLVVQPLSLRSIVRGFQPSGTGHETRRLTPTPPIEPSSPSSSPPNLVPRDVLAVDTDHFLSKSPTPLYFPPRIPAVTTEDESGAMLQAGASAQARRSTIRKTYSKSPDTTPVEAPISTFPSRTIKFDSPPPVVREKGASAGSQPFPPAVFKSRHVTLKGLAIWPPPDTGDPRAYRAGNRISSTWNETRISSPMFLPPFRDPNGVEMMPGERGPRDPRSIGSPDLAMRQFLAVNQPSENESNEELDQLQRSVDSHSLEQSTNKGSKFSKRFLSSFLSTARRTSRGSPDPSSSSPQASFTSTPSSKPSSLAGSDYELKTSDLSIVFPAKPRLTGMRAEPIEGDRERDSTYSTSGSSGRLSPHLFPLPPGNGTSPSDSPPSSNSIHRMQAEHLQAKSSQSTLDSFRTLDLGTTTPIVFPGRPGAEYKKEQPKPGGVFPTTSKKLKPMVLPPSAALREAMRAQSESLDV